MPRRARWTPICGRVDETWTERPRLGREGGDVDERLEQDQYRRPVHAPPRVRKAIVDEDGSCVIHLNSIHWQRCFGIKAEIGYELLERDEKRSAEAGDEES